MRKNLAAVATTVMLALTMTACGEQAADSTQESKATQAVAAQQTTQAATTKATEAAKTTEAAQATEAVKETTTQTAETATEAAAQATEAATQAPAVQITEAATEALAAQGGSSIGSVNVGDVITFGTYEQDNNTGNGAEPIEWIVADVQGGKALVISKYGLDCIMYNEVATAVTWETCSLRTWMNNTFYNAAFTDAEKASIATTTLSNSGANDTTDNVFALSEEEAYKYLVSGVSMTTSGTDYAVANGAYLSKRHGTTGWWLRSTSEVNSDGNPCAQDFNTLGSFGKGSYGGDKSIIAARPAMWVNVG